jgi:tRNA threonylcarbamoyladenosine biosynthesis protein TsaE
MGGRLELVTSSADQTRALAEALAALLTGGDVVSLTGDLGAGKTTFVQGAAAGLGVREPVLSPTFTLVREYAGDRPVYHLDVYRLERMQDVLDLGFDEMLDAGHVVFIEWGDAIEALLPPNHLQVELTIPPSDGVARRIALDAQGPAWAPRWERLEQVVSPWKAD